MDPTSSSLSPPAETLRAISYDSTVAAEPPVTTTKAISPSLPVGPIPNGRMSPRIQSETPSIRSKSRQSSVTRPSTARPADDGHATPTGRTSSLRSATSVPQIRVEQHANPSKKSDKWWKPRKSEDNNQRQEKVNGATFHGIELDIPSGALDGFTTDNLEFSKRGSVMMGGQKSNGTNGTNGTNGHLRPTPPTRRIKSNPSLRAKAQQQKVLSVDEEILSQRVRSFYEMGSETAVDGDDRSSISQNNATIWEENNMGPEAPSTTSLSQTPSRNTSRTDMNSASSIKNREGRSMSGAAIKREDMELAGGFEDWQDVENGYVDRYGFIMARSPFLGTPKVGVQRAPSSLESQGLQRVSTSLQLASETPRRKHTIRRNTSNAKSTRSSSTKQSVKSMRPSSSQSSYQDGLPRSQSRMRIAANKLPHNRDRRIVDEASDMLTLPHGLAEISEEGIAEVRESPQMKRTEFSREEKWQKMAKVVSNSTYGGGMAFEFDTNNPKLIERTWKGIPDRWRASAWYSFLSSSANKRKASVSEEELIRLYKEYQDQSSPEDVQIDIDVPRTISSHIMFRRRYRGGQRLLFRVLHAMSLHFPDTGYVQGMATLAATLLAYFDEEHAFVMLVRLWELRGLEKLYYHGFEGLLEALNDFETGWLRNGEVAVKLVRAWAHRFSDSVTNS